MRETKKVTANIPRQVLEDAQRVTGAGVTQTIIEGLAELRRRSDRAILRDLKGKVRIELDLEKTRR